MIFGLRAVWFYLQENAYKIRKSAWERVLVGSVLEKQANEPKLQKTTTAVRRVGRSVTIFSPSDGLWVVVHTDAYMHYRSCKSYYNLFISEVLVDVYGQFIFSF